MPKGVGYSKKKMKVNNRAKGTKKTNFASQMAKVSKIMSKK